MSKAASSKMMQLKARKSSGKACFSHAFQLLFNGAAA
jgi:hypothetical protein